MDEDTEGYDHGETARMLEALDVFEDDPSDEWPDPARLVGALEHADEDATVEDAANALFMLATFHPDVVRPYVGDLLAYLERHENSRTESSLDERGEVAGAVKNVAWDDPAAVVPAVPSLLAVVERAADGDGDPPSDVLYALAGVAAGDPAAVEPGLPALRTLVEREDVPATVRGDALFALAKASADDPEAVLDPVLSTVTALLAERDDDVLLTPACEAVANYAGATGETVSVPALVDLLAETIGYDHSEHDQVDALAVQVRGDPDLAGDLPLAAEDRDARRRAALVCCRVADEHPDVGERGVETLLAMLLAERDPGDVDPATRRHERYEDLTEVSGVDESKADALRAGGYEDPAALALASQTDLADVEGVGKALAARIKADVGDAEDTAGTGDAPGGPAVDRATARVLDELPPGYDDRVADVVAGLGTALREGDAESRAGAASAVEGLAATYPDAVEGAVPALVDGLRDDDAGVRARSAAALAALVPDHATDHLEEVRSLVATLVEEEGGRDSQHAADVLARVGDPDQVEDALRWLFALAGGSERQRNAARETLEALATDVTGRLAEVPHAMPAGLRFDSWGTRVAAAAVLDGVAASHPDVVPVAELGPALEDDPPVVRASVADALAVTAAEDPGAVAAEGERLVALLEDPDFRVRAAAARALGAVGTASDGTAPAPVREADALDHLEPLADDPYEVVRAAAADALSSLSADLDALLERARRRADEAAAAREAGEYDDAVDAWKRARDAYEDALAATERDGSDETVADVQSALDRVDDNLETTRRERHHAEMRAVAADASEAVETGNERFEDGDHEAAREAYQTAREYYERAAEVAREHGFEEADRYDAALDDLARSVEDCRLASLSARIDDAAATLESDPPSAVEAFEALREDLADHPVADERPEDLAALRERARKGYVRAHVAAGRERLATLEDALDEGTPLEAKEGFETLRERLEGVLSESADWDLPEARGELDDLVETCGTNAGRARRALYDVDEATPAFQGADDVADPTTSFDPGDAGAVGGDAGRGERPPSTRRHREDEQLRDALPDHEHLDVVGSGGSADVSKVRLDDGGEVLALKVPRWEGTLSADVVERFTREAETWARLDDHDNIVSVHDWGTTPYPWLLLEYVPGDLLAATGDWDPAETVALLASVADALEHAHGRGVVHRDVKPENVLLAADDTPKVADWGLARVMLRATRTEFGLTPAYSAPEQLSAERGSVDRQTDVYQLGALAYEVLTGEPPFDADRPVDLQRRILEEPPTPPSVVDDDLPGALDEPVLGALAKDRGERFEAAILFRNALRDAVER